MPLKLNIFKTLTVIFFIVLSPAIFASFSLAVDNTYKTASYFGVKVYLNDAGDVSTTALLNNGTTYCSVKDFNTYFQASITKQSAYGSSITLNNGTNSVIFYLDGKYMDIDGVRLFTDSKTLILQEGKYYIKLRDLARAFNLSIQWDGTLKEVHLLSNAPQIKNATFSVTLYQNTLSPYIWKASCDNMANVSLSTNATAIGDTRLTTTTKIMKEFDFTFTNTGFVRIILAYSKDDEAPIRINEYYFNIT